MPKKIIAIIGSYRKGKTIDTLIDKAIEGIKGDDSSIEVEKIQLYWLEVNAMTQPMIVREDQAPYGSEES